MAGQRHAVDGKEPRSSKWPTFPPSPLAAVCASPDNIDVFGAGAGNTPWWWHWDGCAVDRSGARSPAVRTFRPSGSPPCRPRQGASTCSPPERATTSGAGRRSAPRHGASRISAEDLRAGGVSAVSWGRIESTSSPPRGPRQSPAALVVGWRRRSLDPSLRRSSRREPADGTVSAVSHAVDRLDVFGISRDRRIAHWEWDGQRWNGPDFRGDNIPAGDVSAVVRNPHQLDVFVAGAETRCGNGLAADSRTPRRSRGATGRPTT